MLTKEQAGVLALARFDEAAGIVDVALAHVRDLPLPASPPRAEWRARAVALMSATIASAGRPDGRDAARA